MANHSPSVSKLSLRLFLSVRHFWLLFQTSDLGKESQTSFGYLEWDFGVSLCSLVLTPASLFQSRHWLMPSDKVEIGAGEWIFEDHLFVGYFCLTSVYIGCLHWIILQGNFSLLNQTRSCICVQFPELSCWRFWKPRVSSKASVLMQ